MKKNEKAKQRLKIAGQVGNRKNKQPPGLNADAMIERLTVNMMYLDTKIKAIQAMLMVNTLENRSTIAIETELNIRKFEAAYMSNGRAGLASEIDKQNKEYEAQAAAADEKAKTTKKSGLILPKK